VNHEIKALRLKYRRKSFSQGDRVRITGGEYAGKEGVVYGSVRSAYAVGTSRGRIPEPQYRVYVPGTHMREPSRANNWGTTGLALIDGQYLGRV
jgi:ribosomal protein L21E